MFSGTRNPMRLSALRQSLTLTAVFLLLLGLAGLVARPVIFSQLRSEFDAFLLEDHTELKREFVANGGVPGWFNARDADALTYQVAGFRSADGVIIGAIRSDVFDDQGFNTISAEDLFGPAYFAALEKVLLDETPGMDFSDVSLAEDIALEKKMDWRVYVGPVLDGQLAVFAPVDDFEDILSVILLTMVLTGVALTLIVLMGGIFFGLRAQKRLDRISLGLDQIAQGDLTFRLNPVGGGDDLNDVMRGIDRATVQLEKSVRQITDFSHNLAHDLRTPLARLRARLEEAREPEDIQHALDQTDEVIRVFDAVQRIARLNVSARKSEFTQVDLREIAMTIAEMYEAVAEDAEQHLFVVAPVSVHVFGDRQQLVQALSNLVENAIQYAGPRVLIEIRVGEYWISVCDSGPGIPEDERDRVIEPFYRIACDRQHTGSGLGLALVKAIADAHDAELILEQSAKGGLAASLTFRAQHRQDSSSGRADGKGWQKK